MSLTRMVVAVDGPSGSGKSSTTRGVARRLGLRYLDTGAMYRAMTWWMLRTGVDVHDAGAVAARAGDPVLTVGIDPDAPTIAVDGVDVSGPIRSRDVTNAVSAVSAVPAVRTRMVELQRQLIGAGGIAVEGRDIGTTVAPDADLKIYLVAEPEERARRRTVQGLGDARVSMETVEAEMARRDRLDSRRDASPMSKADDAVVVDTTAHSLMQVVDLIVEQAKERVAG